MFWLILVAVLLLFGVAIVAGMTIGSATGAVPSASASDSSRPTPTTTVPMPTETAAPPPVAGPAIPADCADIYTRDWSADLGGLVLNPAWTEEAGNGPFWGSNDSGAITVLESTTKLTCAWVGSSGGGDAGIITNIASLTDEQQASIIEHLESIGHSCYEELGGTRCVVESNSDAGDVGESHFVREGIWSATRWSNLSADGYTHDIVAAIFG